MKTLKIDIYVRTKAKLNDLERIEFFIYKPFLSEKTTIANRENLRLADHGFLPRENFADALADAIDTFTSIYYDNYNCNIEANIIEFSHF